MSLLPPFIDAGGPPAGSPTRPVAPAPAPAAAASGLVPGRSCETCTVCCKAFGIPELDKNPGQWCRHVVQARGCGIHEARPQTCRLFFCHWMRNGSLGPEWRPDRAKFVMYTEMEGRRLVVAPDAGLPASWRRAPYYAQFKRWAALGAARSHQLLVFNGERATAILPDRDVALGVVLVGDRIVYRAAAGRIEVENIGKA